MNLDRIGIDCPLYEFDCSDIEFDIGEFYALSPNNGKLTLTHNGVSIGDFTANQQEDETINIVTPTSEDITNAVAGEALLREQADNTLQSNINAEQLARERADRDIQSVLDGESLARSNADIELQRQIDAIASKSDVVDVVANYAALQAYDTSKLNDNDVVKVLDDETHGDTMTYYRWNKSTSSWSYIGQEAAYYSKSQMDTLLATKQDNLTAGTGIDITGATISADTTILATKSELSNYAEKSDTYTKTEVDNLVEPKLSVEVVENLPVTGEENKLYLTEKAKTIQTATGNPITATITDGAGNLSDFKLDGDTYQQTYIGKNLLNYTSANYPVELKGITATLNNDGSISVSGILNSSYAIFLNNDITIELEDGATYTISSDSYSPDVYIDIVAYTTGGTGTYPANTRNGAASFTVNKSSFNKYLVRLQTYTVESWGDTAKTITRKFQLEKNLTATSWEPYVGGVASPNPDYPQAIKTVTGEQTVTINSTDYPINLGSIELSKIGTYQDYIYKDGNDWKVHKATSKIVYDGLNNSFSGRANTNASGKYRFILDGEESKKSISESSSDALFNGVCDKLPIGSRNATFQVSYLDGNAIAPRAEAAYGYIGVVYAVAISGMTLEQANEWLKTNNMTVVYALAAPTDTVITDSALIAQLEAIRTASLENGSNTLSNSATGSNLAGDMEISYYGYNPTNRYDKWLWLDINNSYEQLGS